MESSFSVICVSLLILNPNNLPAGDHIVTTEILGAVIYAWRDAQLVVIDDSPMWMVSSVKRDQNTMASFAGAIKRKPFRAQRRTNQHCAFDWQLLRNLVGGFNNRDNPPEATGNPFPPRNSY
jgi:hypothetical protein